MSESNVINALKRLERAGSEESRATEKLRQAAKALSDHIVDQIGDAIEYNEIVDQRCADLPREFVAFSSGVYDAFDSEAVYSTRKRALSFAQAVATGWLDELSDWLEARTSGSAEAVAVLERAAEAMH